MGVAVLAWTAAKMIVEERLVEDYFAARPMLAHALYAAVIGGVFAAGAIASRRRKLAFR